jgi:hypothetical protein
MKTTKKLPIGHPDRCERCENRAEVRAMTRHAELTDNKLEFLCKPCALANGIKPMLSAVKPVCCDLGEGIKNPADYISGPYPDDCGGEKFAVHGWRKCGGMNGEHPCRIADVFDGKATAQLYAAAPELFAENIKLKSELLASLNPEAVKLVGSRIAELEKQNAGLVAALEKFIALNFPLKNSQQAAEYTSAYADARAAIASVKGGGL